MFTKLLFGWVATIIHAFDDAPLLCSCADGWGCADCQLLAEEP